MNLPLLSQEPTTAEFSFWVAAFIGTIFFVVRTGFLLLGGDTEFEVDGVEGADGFDAHDGLASDSAFRLFSLNSISSFVMMFGWSGLAALKEFHLGNFGAITAATIVGFIGMSATASIFFFARKLTSLGADFHIESVVGIRGTVYQRIPEDGRGKIHIHVNGMLRELDAESDGSYPLDSFTPVEVVKVTGPGLVVVMQVSE